MNNLIKKGVVVAVIILFVSVSVIPSTGTNVVKKSSVSDASNIGVDLAIVEIVPYLFNFNPSFFQSLYFTAKVTNIGDAPCNYMTLRATCHYLRTGKLYEDTSYTKGSGLQPGESYCPQYGWGIWFNPAFNFPRLYRIEFDVSPNDSKPNNNHLEQDYLIWAFFGAHYKKYPIIW